LSGFISQILLQVIDEKKAKFIAKLISPAAYYCAGGFRLACRNFIAITEN
jgi:hypothetical protein